MLKQQVEGTDAKEWIQQQALDETKRNMAACSEFNEHKLSFTSDELESCRQQAEAYYEPVSYTHLDWRRAVQLHHRFPGPGFGHQSKKIC